MESFATQVNGKKPLTIVAKHFILDVCDSTGNVSNINNLIENKILKS